VKSSTRSTALGLLRRRFAWWKRRRTKPFQPPLKPDRPQHPTRLRPKPNRFPAVLPSRGIVIVSSMKEFNPDGVPLKAGAERTNNEMLANPTSVESCLELHRTPMDESKCEELQRAIVLFVTRQHESPPGSKSLYRNRTAARHASSVIVLKAG